MNLSDMTNLKTQLFGELDVGLYICIILKKVLSILMAVLIIAQMMINVGIGVYYHLNKEYISNQLCINKSNPALHCNGHCYLSKQLKNAEQREKQSSQTFKEKDEIFSNDAHAITVGYLPSFTIAGFIPYSSSGLCTDNYNALIKPPAA